jgi:hypothetical protein
MKTTLLFLMVLAGIGARAQAPTIAGDLILCPNGSGTAYTVTDMDYDTYQWQWKYWFTGDPFVDIPGADEATFTYDWATYDQALLKLVVTLDGETYESNTLQIDSWAFLPLATGYDDSENVGYDPETGNTILCEGTSFTLNTYPPYSITQWYKDGEPIPGANEMQLHVNEAGAYYVVAAPEQCPEFTSSSEAFTYYVVIEDCGLGTDDPGSLSLSVYPNPAKDQLTVRAGVTLEDFDVYSMTGQRVLSGGFGPGQTVAVASLASGLYILEVESGGNVGRARIIIE